MAMDYSKVKDWIIREDAFEPTKLGKCEAIMSLGNGYLGLRSATEEAYLRETRGIFVAGTFNKFDEHEVTELPNSADLTGIEIKVDGESFDLTAGAMADYTRELNIKNGELFRSVTWTSPAGKTVQFSARRMVSLKDLHQIAQKIEVTPAEDVTIVIRSGINGTVTNTGAQHFSEGDKRFYDKRVIQYVQKTTQSGISFVDTTTHKLVLNGEELSMDADVFIERREIFAGYEIAVPAGQTLTIEKLSCVYTTRDLDMEGNTVEEIQTIGREAVLQMTTKGYDALLAASAAQWEKEVWERSPIVIEGTDEAVLDAFAVHFAQYHLRIMVPAHDKRMNIAAKGLSGEGYKGHCFWDTEIFLLPYYTFTAPEVARKLAEYRYLSLPGAHEKAKQNGYAGAMFPWESAWLDDGEVTPEFCDVDILTGRPVKVWSGIIEQHITSDVAFGAWQYATITGDEAFMDECGYELMMDTAIFWASRLEDGEDGLYHINDVVGPDEFREHVNDNAFTNYMAKWNMEKAMEYYHLLKKEKPAIFAALNEKLDLDVAYEKWADGCAKMYLPQPTEKQVLPQDDRYLSCRDIDLTKYKQQEHIGGIMRDYNLEQINQIQVSKQADVLVLFFLLEDQFSPEVKAATWKYYEQRTIHDSSLSLSTHAVLACDMKQTDMAYDLFQKASMIDLGTFMGSSNAGIHAASFGGTWQCVVYGFGGVRMLGGKLRIDPILPKAWEKLSYTLLWKGQKLAVEVTKDQVLIENLTGTAAVEVEVAQKPCTVEKKLQVTL